MDCIAAIATGMGTSAIGIVRVSGDGCFGICDGVFRPNGSGRFSDCAPRTMVLGSALDRSGTVIDNALAVRFPGPGSYTGEDCAEIHCHGSPVVLREVLEALFQRGARQAGPGEFTKRAFLSGHMDLTQAEAVADLIDAETAAAAVNAAAQLTGGLRRDFDAVTDALTDAAARFYAVVDYPDEDIPDIHPDEIASTLADADRTLSRLLDTFERGRILRHGVRTAIVGRPNAGKSSLLNALVGFDRAIVTDVPGTTRDTVEASALVGGVLLRLVDTAGLHDTADPIERLGVQRTRAAVDDASLILVVHDSADESPADGGEYLEIVRMASASGTPWIAVENKCDVSGLGAFSMGHIGGGGTAPAACVALSAATGDGLDHLADAVAALFPVGTPPDTPCLLTNPRQVAAVRRAVDAIRRGGRALTDGLTPDAALADLEDALDSLGELSGRTARDAIVDAIFDRFCVGK